MHVFNYPKIQAFFSISGILIFNSCFVLIIYEYLFVIDIFLSNASRELFISVQRWCGYMFVLHFAFQLM